MKWQDSTTYDLHPHEEDNPFINDIYLSYLRISNPDTIGSSVKYEELLHVRDSLAIFRRVLVNDKTYHLHSAPSLFINKGALSTAYLENFNKTMDVFTSHSVVMHKSKKQNLNTGLNQDSQLQYILSQRPLKYAYYLTILMGLLFVYFFAKRRQKAIPILETRKNTSLEYIETMSALFMAQDQNEKLVNHMKTNFYHKIKTAYFLNANDPKLAEKLSKKSKIPKAQIDSILKQLNIVNNYAFNDDQLIRLYNDINSFDKNRK